MMWTLYKQKLIPNASQNSGSVHVVTVCTKRHCHNFSKLLAKKDFMTLRRKPGDRRDLSSGDYFMVHHQSSIVIEHWNNFLKMKYGVFSALI